MYQGGLVGVSAHPGEGPRRRGLFRACALGGAESTTVAVIGEGNVWSPLRKLLVERCGGWQAQSHIVSYVTGQRSGTVRRWLVLSQIYPQGSCQAKLRFCGID
jgi:hypothetical protein